MMILIAITTIAIIVIVAIAIFLLILANKRINEQRMKDKIELLRKGSKITCNREDAIYCSCADKAYPDFHIVHYVKSNTKDIVHYSEIKIK